MGSPPTANLSNTSPAAPAGAVNVRWQNSPNYTGASGLPQRDVSGSLAPFVGDSGAGGAPGAVPAPGAGDSGLGKYLRADGTWHVPPAYAGGVQLISANYTITAADNGKLLVLNVSGSVAFTLPNPPPSPDFTVSVDNPTPGTLSVSPNGLLLDGVTGNLNVGKNQGCQIATDGLNYYTERGMPSGGTGGGGGGGTVTSVGLTMPPEFVVANSPITGFGTITVSDAAEPANSVWAGPSSGVAAPPAFRVLATADIPPIPESGVTNLITDLALKAPLASPAFSGTPTAPTPATNDNSTTLATTALVISQIAASAPGLAPVKSVAGKIGAVTLVEADITNLVSDLALKAPLASPVFTGSPAAPSLTIGTAGTSVAAALLIANASTNTGSAKQTQIATGISTSVNGIGGASALFAIADATVKWMLNMDGAGNLGIAGTLCATTLNAYPTTQNTGINVSATAGFNASISIVESGTPGNFCQVALVEVGANYFSDTVVADGVVRATTGKSLRLGTGGGASAIALTGTNAYFNGKILSYGGVTTAAMGVPVIVASPGAGTSGSTSYAIALLTGAPVGNYRVSAFIFNTAAASGTIAITITFKCNGAVQTLTVCPTTTVTASNTWSQGTLMIRHDDATAAISATANVSVAATSIFYYVFLERLS